MKVTSTGISNGIIADRFGKRGPRSPEGTPSVSLPLKIEGAPGGTVSYAIFLEDKDAVPVCGFSWIHWLVANLTRTELAEDESRHADGFVQGATSSGGRLGGLSRAQASFYEGMAPPDAPHLYEIHVYALDTQLPLKNGFYLNELWKAMDGHVLEQCTLKGTYRN